MKAYSEYWVATMIRGLLAVVAGTGVLFIPEMASTILLLPFAVVISILCLAAYGTIDSAIILTTSFMIPRQQPGRLALRVQGICGAVIGILLFALVSDRAELHWFIYLAAIQAATAAITEFIVARGTSAHHGAKWCYASAAVAAISSIALLFGKNLSPRELAWLLYGYLGVFGFNLFALSARMLFAEREFLNVGHLRTKVTAGQER
ncbi:hypothetical protein [Edaphobacter aggregans]|uniref:hypothetical protein n=1 Tax=Edaphobacter aggregans TaxID=570835 RepID=UPI000551ABF3|nr:hypothetical protein [Edaphobacter aggregans]